MIFLSSVRCQQCFCSQERQQPFPADRLRTVLPRFLVPLCRIDSRVRNGRSSSINHPQFTTTLACDLSKMFEDMVVVYLISNITARQGPLKNAYQTGHQVGGKCGTQRSSVPPNMSTKFPKACTMVKVSKKIAERMVPLRLLSNLMLPVKKMVRKSIKMTFHNKNKPGLSSPRGK